MDEERKVLVFERGPLVFVLNFSPTEDYEGLEVAVPVPGKWRVALDSDAWDLSGRGRVGHDVDHFSEPASSVVKEAGGLFHDRGQLIRVLSPSRTAVVYYRVDEEAERRAREEREWKKMEEARLRESQEREREAAELLKKPAVKIVETPQEGML